jgi:hypothetical protein
MELRCINMQIWGDPRQLQANHRRPKNTRERQEKNQRETHKNTFAFAGVRKADLLQEW